MSPRRALPLLAALVLAVCGCGSSPTSQEASGDLLTLFQHDFYFDPQVVHAKPGRLELQVVNRGRLPHNFRIEKGGREVGRTSALKPGEADRVSVRLTRGDYRYFCSVGNHEELGLYGTLVVR